MPPGAIVGLIVIGLLAIWGLYLRLSRKNTETQSQTSSHYESGAGALGAGSTDSDQ